MRFGNPQFSTVHAEPGIYASHPANHGGWQWGDELLVGFLRGKHGVGEYHAIQEPYEKWQARSLDGGRTWCAEVPSVDFSGIGSKEPASLDLADSIIRCCGIYDTGGDDCPSDGAFYMSHDKGRSWSGPHGFEGMDIQAKGRECSARTCVLPELSMVFLTSRVQRQFGSDIVLACKVTDGKFSVVSEIASPLRTVMPAAAVLGDRVIVAVRRPAAVEAYWSELACKEWHGPFYIAATGGNYNGNPPALAVRNGVVYAATADRASGAILIKSSSNGERWDDVCIVKQGPSSDIGYCRLFAVSDGLACVYYWTDKEGGAARIECARIVQ